MKKRILCLTLACLLALCCVALLSCGDNSHTHTFADGWTSDNTNHWHAASCEHTDEKSGLAAHDWDDGEVTTQPTETEDGVKTYTCTVCDATKTESVAALGHTHTYADTLSYDEGGHYYAATCAHSNEKKDYTAHQTTPAVTAPTCTTAGYTTHTCACGYSFKDTPVAALDHAYGSWTPDGEGHHSRVCANDETHVQTEDCVCDSVVTAPTCTTAGYTTHTCACGYSFKDTPVAALDHAYGSWTPDGEGHHSRVCANDETHVQTEDCVCDSVVTAPTCTTAGYTTHTCACGYSFKDTPVAALDHAYGSWTSTGEGQHSRVCANDETHVQTEDCEYDQSVTAPGCTTGGYTTYTCDVCGDSYVGDETEATGHSFSTAWSTNDAYHWHDTLCGHGTERSVYEAHSFTEFVVTVAPTCDTDGYTTYKCKCGKTENRDTVQALGHSYGEFEEIDRILYDESCCQYAVTWATSCSRCGDPQQKVEYTENHSFYYEKEENNICAVTGENALRKPTCQEEGIQHKHCANPTCRYYAEAAEVTTYENPEAHVWDEGTQNGNVITYACTLCPKTKNTAVVTDGTTADISGGQVDEVEIGNTTINMNEAMKDTLTKDKTDPVSITAGVTEDEQQKKDLLEQYGFTLDDIGNQPIYSFTVTGADEASFGVGGVATITIPYTLGEGDDRNNIIVFYISNGKLEAIEADYFEKDGQGFATFQTSHFSDYVPTSVMPEELCELFGKHSDDVHVVAPGCTTDGYTVCLRCNRIIETVPALGHKWLSEVAVATTCEQNGVMHYACAECDAAFDTILPATGHYHVLSTYAAATCQSEGRSVYGCIYCDDEYTVTVPQLSHQYQVKSVASTCVERGYTQRTCALCADVQTTYVPALGHSFGTGFEKAEEGHYHVCAVCGGRDEVHPHEPGDAATEAHAQLCTVCEYVIAPQLTHQHKNMTHFLANEPTCTQNGNKEYFVCACGKWFLDEQGTQLVTDHTSVVLLALGHTNEDIPYLAPTCTEAGHTAGVKCAVCDVLLKGNIRIAPAGHDYAQNVTKPTCTEGGYTTYTCTCGDHYVSNETAPLGHRYNVTVTAPTCTEGGFTTYTCQKCAHTYKDAYTEALGHSFTAAWKTNAVEHWHECTRCSVKVDVAEHIKDYESATEEHGVSCTVCALVMEPIKDHTHAVKTAYAAQEAGCERSGKKAYVVCSCGDWFFDDACTQPVTDRTAVVIPATGHKLIRVEQVDATCQKEGVTAGYTCENCSYVGGCTVIETVPHKFIDLKYDESAHWYKCATCNETTAPEAHGGTEHVVAPGCTTPGYTEYSCDCGYEYVGDHLPAAGHSFGDWLCNYDGTHTSVCERDPRHQQTNRCEYEIQVTAPTCTKGGYTTYTCSACGHSYVGDRTAALGHTEVVDAAVAPTCTATGLTEGKHCDACGEVLVAQTVVDALGHTEVVDAAVAPTCTATGLTEGKHCDACGEILVAQTVVDALGHTEVVDAAVAPTCTATGLTEGKHCDACGEVLVAQTVIDALGHSFQDGVCQNCGESDKVEYGTNTILVEVVYDEKSGEAYLKVSVKNADLAGILFTLTYGGYECYGVECPENAAAYDAGGVVNYVFSGGENTAGEQELLVLHLSTGDRPLDSSRCEVSVEQIYRFAENGELETPAYTVINVQ